MAKKQKELNLLGFWRQINWYANCGGDWVPLYPANDPPYYYIFNSKFLVEGGRFWKKTLSTYEYLPEDNLLKIDELVFGRNKSADECAHERFRVVRRNRWSISLYMLRGDGKDSDDYLWRVDLRRRLIDIVLNRY